MSGTAMRLAPVFQLGGSAVPHGDSDCDQVFRQESFFHWLFGGLEPDWYGAVEVESGRSILFVPKVPESATVYMGLPLSPNQIKHAYSVDECHWVEDYGVNTDSGRHTKPAMFSGIENFKVDRDTLHPEISECRVFKTPQELEVMRYCNRISSQAHRHLMKSIKPGMYEYQAESLFHHYCYTHGGMRHVSYTCICASGLNASILHYGHAGAPNERQLRDGDMCLFDMGGEYYCYTSDITCSFPVNGRFTADQRIIYQAVYDASRAVIDAVKPGASWPELHKLAERVILSRLHQAKLIKGDLDEMMETRLSAVFMPHGLGHLIGCDTHDVGGYLPGKPSRLSAAGLKNLRMARVLEPNMVLTVEPGCYFIDCLLDQAIASQMHGKFMCPDVIERFRGFGGVRIEDDLIVTETGHEMLTDVPRTIEEIEEFMTK